MALFFFFFLLEFHSNWGGEIRTRLRKLRKQHTALLLRGREPVGENKPGIQVIGIWARIWSVSKARSQAFRNRCSIHTYPTLHHTGFDYEMFWNVQTERVVFVQRNRGPHPWLLLTLLLSLWGKKAVTFVFWVLVSVWEGRRGEDVNVKNGKEGWIPFSLPPEESFLYLSCLFLSCVCVFFVFFFFCPLVLPIQQRLFLCAKAMVLPTSAVRTGATVLTCVLPVLPAR